MMMVAELTIRRIIQEEKSQYKEDREKEKQNRIITPTTVSLCSYRLAGAYKMLGKVVCCICVFFFFFF
jgi:hypothetical protein